MGREKYIPVKGIKLSEGGMSFRTEESLAISSLIQVQMALYTGSRSQVIDCQGVVRSFEFKGDENHGAIEFTNMSEKDRKIIQRYMKE